MHNTYSETFQPSLTEVRLYGHLRARFGKSYMLAVSSAAEAVRALSVVVPGFKTYLYERSAPGYRVWLGNDVVQKTDELAYPGGRLIRIVPVTAGAKSGIGSIILGAALIGASFIPGLNLALVTGYTVSISSIAFGIGTSLVLGGVSQMIAGNPAAPAPSERPDNKPSYAFNGAVNTTAQGNAVPILYGRLRVGSQIISTGLAATQLDSSVPAAPTVIEPTPPDETVPPEPEGGGGGTE